MRIRRSYTLLQKRWILRGLRQTGENISIFGPIVLLGREHITLGSRVSIAGYLHIWGHGGVTIGDDVLIASHVAISSITHDTGSKLFNLHNVGRKVRIGDNVWIGSHAFIGAGVTVGDGAIVGAGAVVLKDVEPHTVAGGVPARKLRDLADRETT